jgi:hypothetical protein
MVKPTDPEGMNGQPVRHEELAALRGLAGDKEGRFLDAISLVDPAVLYPGQVFVHVLHGVPPNGRGSGISGMQISAHLLQPPVLPPPQYVSHQLTKDASQITYSAWDERAPFALLSLSALE